MYIKHYSINVTFKNKQNKSTVLVIIGYLWGRVEAHLGIGFWEVLRGSWHADNILSICAVINTRTHFSKFRWTLTLWFVHLPLWCYKHMKKYSTPLSLGKGILKPQWNISHPLAWLTSVGENTGTRKPFYTAGGTVKWWGHFGKQYGRFSSTYT